MHNQYGPKITQKINKSAGEQAPQTVRPKFEKPGAEKLRVLSRDPDKAMQEMMETIDDLKNLYAKENEALRSGDVHKFMKMQEDKLLMAYQYQSDVKNLMERSDDIKEKGSKFLIESLRKKHDEFEKMGNKNKENLERMDRIMGRIGERLINAAKRAALSESVSYTSSGSINGKAKEVVSTGVIETA